MRNDRFVLMLDAVDSPAFATLVSGGSLAAHPEALR